MKLKEKEKLKVDSNNCPLLRPGILLSDLCIILLNFLNKCIWSLLIAPSVYKLGNWGIETFTCPGSHNPVMELQFVAKQFDFRDSPHTKPITAGDWEDHRAMHAEEWGSKGWTVLEWVQEPLTEKTSVRVLNCRQQWAGWCAHVFCMCVWAHHVDRGWEKGSIPRLKKKKPPKYVHLRDCK